MVNRSEGSLIEKDRARRWQKQTATNSPLQHQVTINTLPDDVLLEIFDHYMPMPMPIPAHVPHTYVEWQTLVHVCQKWRHVVFRSPLRLNLRILCLEKTPVMEKLALWPALPIVIMKSITTISQSSSKCGENNIIAALGHVDCVCEIHLDTTESVLAEMQKTFVALEILVLSHTRDTVPPVISDSFLGGSAPRLRRLTFRGISFPFPVLRNLLLSAPNLANLSLSRIPHSSYFSQEVMVACLSTLTRLSRLRIGFESPRSRPSREGLHPSPTLSVFPALTELRLIGASEYVEDLVARIDAPLLDQLYINFFHQLIFDTPQLAQFLIRTPKFKAYDEALVNFSYLHATITLPGGRNLGLEWEISCKQSDWQLSSLAQLCTSSFPQPLIPMLGHLYILWDEFTQEDLESTQWLEFFHPFTTVKNLYLSGEFSPRILRTLQDLVGIEVLPNLESIFLEDFREPGRVPEVMQQFITTSSTARQLSGRPIVISPWNRGNLYRPVYKY